VVRSSDKTVAFWYKRCTEAMTSDHAYMEGNEILSAELEDIRAQLAELHQEVARNEGILRKSQGRELALLHAVDLRALFQTMIFGLADSCGLAQVTVVICDPDHDVRHLLIAGGTEPEELPGLLFVDALIGLAPQYATLTRPWLGRYSAPDHQLIFLGRNDIASIAMIPLVHKEKLIGSLNFGSDDDSRFAPDYASDFLAHLGVIASFALENVVNRARLLRSGFTDVLTGWYNRRYLQVRMKEELARAGREGTNLVCLMIDIDRFKKINDSHGHAAGDEVLCELAQRIESEVRVSDIAARYGGEEFVVLLPNTDTDSGVLLGERIRSAISSRPIELRYDGIVTITASVGIASVMPDATDADVKTIGEALLARADVALYAAKAAGRDRVAVESANAAVA
jgi:diguanylate cyclase (GGDEF)-like protein